MAESTKCLTPIRIHKRVYRQPAARGIRLRMQSRSRRVPAGH